MIDTTAPAAPGTPDLAGGSDLGISSTDDITNDTTPQFTGTCETGATVTLSSSVAGALTPTGTCTGGAYDITVTSSLSQATHNISATQVDLAGNSSPSSSALSVTVDTTAPAAPGTPDLAASSDTGVSNTDDLTSDTTPQFTGTCETGATVTLSSSADGALTPTGTCSGSAYDITVNGALSQATHNITATQTDTAGNSGPASNALSVTVDATAPAAPGTPDLAASSDTGVSSTDNITSDTTPQFTGSCVTGTKVTLSSSVDVALTPTGDCSGSAYDITVTVSLSQAVHNITATQTDPAGNSSPTSSALSVTVDTSVAVPGTPDLAAGSDLGISSTDEITNDTTPQLTGTCETGATVTLSSSVAGALTPTGTCSGSAYDITITSTLSEGIHNISATQVDLAGSSSSASSGLSVTVDTTDPTVTINQDAGQADPTANSPIDFKVIFSEPVSGFATGDVSLSGVAGATTGTVSEIAPNDGTTFNVAVSGMAQDGTVTAKVEAGKAIDAAGNGNVASTSTDDTVTYYLHRVVQFSRTPT